LGCAVSGVLRQSDNGDGNDKQAQSEKAGELKFSKRTISSGSLRPICRDNFLSLEKVTIEKKRMEKTDCARDLLTKIKTGIGNTINIMSVTIFSTPSGTALARHIRGELG